MFDAVGTLIYPRPSVAEAYCRALRLFCGVEVDHDDVARAVRSALQARTSADLSTNEAAEREFWAGLIRELAGNAVGFDACFDHLFAHFANPANWRCFPDTTEAISCLHSAGLRIAIASNFDLRLNDVCNGLPGLAEIEHRVISSVVGWRKPAPEFFDAVCSQLNLPASQILFVGDDVVNDVQGALKAGMQSAWITRNDSDPVTPQGATAIRLLTELPGLQIGQ